MKNTTLLATLAAFIAWQAPTVQAVEVFLAKELRSVCTSFPGSNADARSCERYVLGFVDGAVATDVRVMLNVEAAQQNRETLTERALRTRVGSSELRRAAGYADFCLGDPVPLREVVANVAADLAAVTDLDDTTPARDLVYASLRKYYPCEAQG